MHADRQYAVASILFEYVKSPSLRHLRDPHSVHRLAREIVKALDGASSAWKKWETQREEVVKAAAPCWIPVEDIQAFLNSLPGPSLTKTDVEQRLRAIWEEPYASYPNDDLKDGCVALYQSEKAQGTEMRAIIGALQEHRVRGRQTQTRARGGLATAQRRRTPQTGAAVSLWCRLRMDRDREI
jgi:hypothetical protein